MVEKITYKTYFIFDPEKKAIKIGLSHQPEKRLIQIQGHNPTKLILLSYFENSELEKELHRRFKEFRIRGEWFESKSEIFLEIINLLKSPIFIKKKIEIIEESVEPIYKALSYFLKHFTDIFKALLEQLKENRKYDYKTIYYLISNYLNISKRYIPLLIDYGIHKGNFEKLDNRFIFIKKTEFKLDKRIDRITKDAPEIEFSFHPKLKKLLSEFNLGTLQREDMIND